MTFCSRSTAAATAVCTLLLVGCANPGPPRPPSLQIPAPVTDLKAERQGNSVDLHFTFSERTSDGVTLSAGQIVARVCRAVETGACFPVPGLKSRFSNPPQSKMVTLQDVLQGDLTTGAPRLLTYRLELIAATGRSAGYSAAAFAAAGSAPRAVDDLHAEGSRLGTVLRWQAGEPESEVLLVREDRNAQGLATASGRKTEAQGKPKKFDFNGVGKEKAAPPVVTLSAEEKSAGAPGAMLDTTALPDVLYRYTAKRRRLFDLEGHKLEVWSTASIPVTFTLHDNFPPPAPAGLSAAGFLESSVAGKANVYSVDLIWEPVQDEQLAGYRVYRLEWNGSANSRGTLLTAAPVPMPAFHDTTANGSKRYRYSVTSVDRKGNESEAATTVLEPQSF